MLSMTSENVLGLVTCARQQLLALGTMLRIIYFLPVCIVNTIPIRVWQQLLQQEAFQGDNR